MRVVVTGATGFIGGHFVAEMLKYDHDVVVVSRSGRSSCRHDWASDVHFEIADILEPNTELWRRLSETDLLAHLAWPGLPEYKDLVHFEQNLSASYNLVKAFVTSGCPRVLTTGTCFEYGAAEGMLSESMNTMPTNPYGLAKDCLHRFLRQLQVSVPFKLVWARLFYMHGSGQNPRSLIAQLETAIDRGDSTFPMSGGEQLRDYLTVEQVARYLTMLAGNPEFDGTVNVCSGQPVSVRRLVERQCEQRNVNIELDLGHFPYPDYEPFAFWGDNTLLQSFENAS